MVHIIMNALLLLDFIAFSFFFIRYIKKETIKSAIGWAITSAVMCVLEIILFSISASDLEYKLSNFVIYIMNFGLAISAIIRCKKN